MPIAISRLEVLQIRKLIHCVRERESDQIDKMMELGVPNVVDLQGNYVLFILCHCVPGDMGVASHL